MRPLDQARKFIFVDAFERDRIDLDLQSGGLRGVDAAITCSSDPQRVMARNFSGSSVSSDTLMRPYAHGLEFADIFGKLRAVGGQGQFVEIAAAQVTRQSRKKSHDVAANQRLTAGEA